MALTLQPFKFYYFTSLFELKNLKNFCLYVLIEVE